MESSGDSSAVRKRVGEILLYLNSCYACLKSSIDTVEPHLCQYMCIDCFRNKRICENHDALFDTWHPNGRPCVRCAEKRFNGKELQCIRLHAIISCSDDIGLIYARYGKDISVRFDQLDYIDNQNWPLFHVHDFGHNLKNAEASLERGTHFDGTI